MAVFRAGNTTASRESGSPEQAMYSTEAPFSSMAWATRRIREDLPQPGPPFNCVDGFGLLGLKQLVVQGVEAGGGIGAQIKTNLCFRLHK